MVRKVSVCQIYNGWWYKSCCVLYINQSGLIPRNVRGYQSSTWYDIQDRTKSEDENKNITKNKGTMTQSTCQKAIEEGHCKEVQMNMSHHGNSPLLKSI